MPPLSQPGLWRGGMSHGHATLDACGGHTHGHDHGHAHAHDSEKGDLDAPLLEEHGHDCGHDHGHGHGHAPGGEGHGHSHGEDHGSITAEGKKKLRIAVYCALLFMSIEIAGGVLANSLAIITDAAHMLSDVGGFIISLTGLELAEQVATSHYTFGFKQAEVLLFEAVQRFTQPEANDTDQAHNGA